ncbi:DUF6924 domain-containing protein [Streptomyces sp. NPDC004788]
MPLPQPDDLTSLVLRTDFADDARWDALRSALGALDEHPHATCVSETRFAGAGPGELDFFEFADAADASGTFRGFDGLDGLDGE